MTKNLGRLRLPVFPGDPSPAAIEAEVWYNSFIDQVRFQTPDTPPVSLSMGARFNDFAPNRWYMTTSGGSSTATPTVNRVYAVPINLARYAEISGIAMEVVAAFTTAGNIRAGLYYADYMNSPTNLIADYGTVAATVGIKTWTPSGGITFLAAGSYFLTFVYQGGSSGTPTFRTALGVHEQVGDTNTSAPTSTFFSGQQNAYYASTTQSGALPSTFGTIGGSVAGPRAAVKFNN